MDLSISILRDTIMKMAKMVETMFGECLKDSSTLEDIVGFEKQVNRYHTEVDDLCFKFVALKRPFARDLRFALSVIKINTDLERVGDLALNIKRARLDIHESCPLLKQMAHEAGVMFTNAIDSFVQGDVNLASDVIQNDQIVNDLNRQIIQTYTKQEVGSNFGEAYLIILVSNKLERIGDHSTNIAEDVIFLESGKDVRHQKVYE